MTARTFPLVALAVMVGSLAARVVEWGWQENAGVVLLVVAVAALAWALPYYVRENRAAAREGYPRSNGGRSGK